LLHENVLFKSFVFFVFGVDADLTHKDLSREVNEIFDRLLAFFILFQILNGLGLGPSERLQAQSAGAT
jgi:hypothetical protein